MTGRRITIADIAREAAVSTSAVSYALNNRPGVGAQTKERILAVADQLGWRPSRAARALYSSSLVNSVGLLMLSVERPHGDTADFFVEFLAGVQEYLAQEDVLLVLHSVPDRDVANETYRRWRAERCVDGVILLNPLVRDPRIPFLEELKLPAVVVGDVRGRTDLPAVWTDDQHATSLAISRLVELGHRRIARIGTGRDFLHTEIRRRAFVAATRRAGLASDLSYYTDSRPPHELVMDLLKQDNPPTALLVESSTAAVNIVVGLQSVGIAVPDTISVMSWDDTALCQVVQPAITAFQRNIRGYGYLVAEHLLRIVSGEQPGQIVGTATELVERASIGPPRRAARS